MRSSKFVRRWLCVLGLLGALLGCSQGPAPGEVFGDSLVAAFDGAGPGDRSIRVIELTQFEWDQMHVFPPNSPLKTVSESLGQALPYEVYQMRIFERDDINLIVFLKGGSIVAALPLDRARLEITVPEGIGALAPGAAVFKRSRAGRGLTLEGSAG